MSLTIDSQRNPDGLPLARKVARSSFRIQLDVIHALVLHDIKGRYLGSGLGYLVTIIWPAAHLAILITIFVVTGRVVPNGNSALLYVATGVYPFIVWSYVGRFTMMTALQNRAFLSYPIIRPMDLIVARIILELNTAFIILVWLIAFLMLAGINVVPNDPARAAIGILAAATVGVGFGVLGAVFTFLVPYFFMAYVVVIIVFYPTSGIVINPETMPAGIGDLFYWNPVLHCVEMVRSAYYPDYAIRLLDIRYPFVLGLSALALGLVLERLLRRYF